MNMDVLEENKLMPEGDYEVEISSTRLTKVCSGLFFNFKISSGEYKDELLFGHSQSSLVRIFNSF